MNEYYTYFHTRNDTGAVFYVGKGKGRRAYLKSRINPHWENIVAKCGREVHMAMTGLSEAEAFNHERFLIQCFRDMGVAIVNVGDGGEGLSNPPEHVRVKQRDNIARINSIRDEFGRSVAAVAGGLKGGANGTFEGRSAAGKRGGAVAGRLNAESGLLARVAPSGGKVGGVASCAPRFKCTTCGLITNRGNITKHANTKGHADWEPMS